LRIDFSPGDSSAGAQPPAEADSELFYIPDSRAKPYLFVYNISRLSNLRRAVAFQSHDPDALQAAGKILKTGADSN
jgi:hypothetical protein